MMGAAPPQAANTLPLHAVLKGSGDAMRLIGHLAQRIEEQLLVSVTVVPNSPADTTALQSMDLLLQSITEMSELLNRVAEEAPETAEIKVAAVLNPVKLHWMRDLIAENRGPAWARDEPHSTAALF